MAKQLLSLLLLAAVLGVATAHPTKPKHKHPVVIKPIVKPIIKLPIIKLPPIHVAPVSVWAAIKFAPQYSLLKAALIATKLDKVLKDKEFKGTVFAPTNKAFKRLLEKVGLTLETTVKETKFLEALLKYHVLGSVVKSTDIPKFPKSATVPTLLTGASLTAYKTKSAVIVKAAYSAAKVIKADIKAGKAIVHAIDTVLLPAALVDFPGCKSVAAIATADPRLSSLVAALEAANLTSVFTNKEFSGTVLAPTNKAFKALLKKLKTNLKSLAKNKSLLTTVLTYHVIPTAVPAFKVKNGADVSTLANQHLKAKVNSHGIFFVGFGSTAKVIKADIFSCRGVIHVIDTVLVPKL